MKKKTKLTKSLKKKVKPAKAPRRAKVSAAEPKEVNPFRKIAIAAARAADEKIGIDIVLLDIGAKSDVADYLLIVGVESAAQMGAIEGQIEEDLKALGHRALRRDGTSRERRWMAIDYGNLLVHLLMPQARELYRLDQLWESAKKVNWKK